jgi:hypothetical protein
MNSTLHKITCHPIDFKLLDKLNINSSDVVANPRVGSVIGRLVKAGYTNISTHTSEDQYGRTVINTHCKKDMT